MCGIAGLFNAQPIAEARVECLKRMLASIRHRGPDEMGYYFDEMVAMGTARLSIIDVKDGQQPIGDPSGRYWICFNGEIYNYRELRVELIGRGRSFRTNSDTEVLLHAWIEWGPRALERLNGPFAFAIYDRFKQSLVLARDRYGKRPLFYIRDQGGIVFGSEMKCFLPYDRFKFEFDEAQLASIFRVWTPIEDQSGYRGISQVPAGAYLSVDATSTRLATYAPLELSPPPSQLAEPELLDHLRQGLSDSVQLRLRSDVEVGVYLSGGLDSAIVAQLIAENRPGTLKSFSVEFDDGKFDESDDQQIMARHLGTDHERLRITNQDIVEAFPEALWHAEVPVFRSAFVPMFLLSKLVSDAGIKVVMTGEGADEAFLGYDIFKETLLRSDWDLLDQATRQHRLIHLYPDFPGPDKDRPAAAQAFIDQLCEEEGTDSLFSHQVRFNSSRLSKELLKQGFNGLRPLADAVAASSSVGSVRAALQGAQWLEFKTLLGGYLLSTQGDRMSAAHSVENRCPFLDPNVVALGCATTPRFYDGVNEKYLLRKSFAGRLPREILLKRKRPYLSPDASAFLNEEPDYLELIRSETELKKVDALNPGFCLAFMDRLTSAPRNTLRQADNQTFMFLLSTALLQRRFVSEPAAPLGSIDDILVRTIDGRTLASAESAHSARW